MHAHTFRGARIYMRAAAGTVSPHHRVLRALLSILRGTPIKETKGRGKAAWVGWGRGEKKSVIEAACTFTCIRHNRG